MTSATICRGVGQNGAHIRRVVGIDRSGIEILPGATRREPDGLAMSSRNVRLSDAGRELALAIWRALRAAGDELDPASAESAMALELAGLDVEYAVVRDAETLGEAAGDRPGRALIAVRVGDVRLIDNAPWPGCRPVSRRSGRCPRHRSPQAST